MEKYEYQIIVIETRDNKFWYTAQARRFHFLWRGGWKDLLPMMQPSYWEAADLIKEHRHKQGYGF